MADAPPYTRADSTKQTAKPSGWCLWLPAARGRYAAGVWAMPLALAPAFLLAALLGVPPPLEPLTEGLMQLTPLPVANTLLTLLGDAAHMAALLGALAISLPVGGLLGLVAPNGAPRLCQRKAAFARWAAVVALALLAALLLALAAPTSAQAACALLAGASFAPALTLTRAGRRRLAAEQPPTAGIGTSRRAVLRGILASGATVAGALALGGFDVWSDALAGLLGRGETTHALFAFAPPGARTAGFPVAGTEPEVTPIPHFYLLSKNDVDPRIEPAAWRLALRGAVRHPLLLAYADLLARPRTDVYVTLRCVNNPPGGRLMSTALWSGVPLASLLASAQVQSAARAVVLHAADGYDEVIPLAAALATGALVAYGMNGQTLPRRHGGPVRALVPGFYGLKNVKWLSGITLLTQEAPDYWARRGWTAEQVHSVARIDTWQRVPSGIFIAGVAFTGARGVSAVEVRAEGGPWQQAELNQPALSPLCWVQWRARLPLASGAHVIRARVLDGAGQPQEESVTGEYPDGATGLDAVQVQL